MNVLQIFDRAMCCSTGVCGPSIDPALPRFAADLDWLRSRGVQVDRWNLAQQPAMFLGNATVKLALAHHGTACLPLILVNNQLVSQGFYPPRDQLAEWTGVATARAALPVQESQGSCCGGKSCC